MLGIAQEKLQQLPEDVQSNEGERKILCYLKAESQITITAVLSAYALLQYCTRVE